MLGSKVDQFTGDCGAGIEECMKYALIFVSRRTEIPLRLCHFGMSISNRSSKNWANCCQPARGESYDNT